jgi:hypothetical protein
MLSFLFFRCNFLLDGLHCTVEDLIYHGQDTIIGFLQGLLVLRFIFFLLLVACMLDAGNLRLVYLTTVPANTILTKSVLGFKREGIWSAVW